MSDYHPIACETYAALEIAIVQGTRLRMGWQSPDGHWHLEALLPVDLRSRDHAEFLIAQRSVGRPLEIRLDRIRRFRPL
ncbi:transcriptional antiterminator, Rof [Aquisalimonas lutea]|uniref:transcriptional antiterminator, Rof n=1 Tax=Aquisalimonas lutea TaxID=1327750 RepID=UPI0025B480A6|nr:transcriptional antiterminator, Rof [Aquisalimonas lutea]MDN3516908.1 transcriptional antiterminator, Rof [Aquisalimonas lutea]